MNEACWDLCRVSRRLLRHPNPPASLRILCFFSPSLTLSLNTQFAPSKPGSTTTLPGCRRQVIMLREESPSFPLLPQQPSTTTTSDKPVSVVAATDFSPSPHLQHDNKMILSNTDSLSSPTPSPEPKNGKKPGRQTNPLPRHKRVSHINAEHRRRNKIQRGFETLRQLVPALQENPSTKDSKASMLFKASEHCRQLQAESKAQRDEACALRQQLGALTDEIQKLQLQLPDSGVDRVSYPKTDLRNLFQDYVENRTKQNWKFWIFSFFIKPLFNSFNKMVVTKTTQRFLESLHCWQEEVLSLTNLRQGFLKAFRQISIKTSIMHDPEKLPEESQNGVSLLFASDDGSDSPVSASSSSSLTSLSIDTATPTTLSFASSLSSSASSLSPLSLSTCYTGSSASSTCSTSSSSSSSSYNLVPPTTLENSISPTPPLPDVSPFTGPLNTLLFNSNIATAAAAAAAAAANNDPRTICNYNTSSNNNNTALGATQFNLDELPFLKKCLYYNNNNNNNNSSSSSSQQQQLSADLLYSLDSSFVTDSHSSADWEESTFLLMREHIEGCLPSLSPCPSLQPNVYDLL